MPYRDIHKKRAAGRAWFHRNKGKKKATQERLRVALRAWFADLKRGKSCCRCGEANPVCLHFHHRTPSLKENALADAVRREWSKARIVAELAKCDVLCANCHAKHHFETRLGSRLERVWPTRVHKTRRAGSFVSGGAS